MNHNIRNTSLMKYWKQMDINDFLLPPYHPDLNPIEKIWANFKQYVGCNNITFKLNNEKEQEYIRTEGLVEPEVEKLCLVLIIISSSSDLSEDSSSKSGTETDDTLHGIEQLDQTRCSTSPS
ncbi:hypothetical protein C0J52_07866 [Blattella germanica]|nr:hypothetical protein C0J52_07866 [Blattella germanica]